MIQFRVLGTPKSQGSMKAFNAGGHARVAPSGGVEFAAWRNAVAEAAQRQVAEHGCLDGPLSLRVSFQFRMPASRSKKIREGGTCWKTTAPDTSKLVRALEDGLQAAGLIADDARFAIIHASKCEVFEQWAGADITIGELT